MLLAFALPVSASVDVGYSEPAHSVMVIPFRETVVAVEAIEQLSGAANDLGVHYRTQPKGETVVRYLWDPEGPCNCVAPEVVDTVFIAVSG